MRIERRENAAGERPPESNFVGDVRIAGYYRREAPSRLIGATVSFVPGTRTPWKTNPLGQTLIVLSGRGRIGGGDGTVAEVKAGDLVWWSPGERHWEGAAPDEAMTYTAIQEEDATGVSFLEAVTDDQYAGSNSPR